jgi:plastocyanin
VGAAVVALLALGGLLFLPISDDSPEAVEISMSEYAFAPAVVHAQPGQELRVSNVGAIDHSYVIVGLGKGVELRPGETRSIHLPFDTDAGSYQAICDIPDHVEQGMVGTLEVG